MTTTFDTDQRQDPIDPQSLIPSVCPTIFSSYFDALWSAHWQLKHDDKVPEDRRPAFFMALSTDIALSMLPQDGKQGLQAAAMVYRLLSFIKSIERGDLETIGTRYFGNPEELIRLDGSGGLDVKGIAVLAAACADLLPGYDGYTLDCLAAAVLMVPAGCPMDDCPDRD